MNVTTGLNLSVITPPAPPPPPPAPAKAKDDKPDPKDDHFERMIQAEIERKKAIADATPSVESLAAWLPNQTPNDPFATDAADDSIQATSALEASSASRTRLAGIFGTPLPPQPIVPVGNANARGKKDGSLDDDALAPVKKIEPRASDSMPVHVMVEPELPPVQPFDPKSKEPVSLVQFPQIVAGTATQMVKDGKPLSELNFEINPPHMGPVNLNVSIQERVVTVTIVVPNAQAKQQLETHGPSIASILQGQNLSAGPIRIVTAASGKGGAGGAGSAGSQQGDNSGFGLLNGGRRRSSGADDLTADNL